MNLDQRIEQRSHKPRQTKISESKNRQIADLQNKIAFLESKNKQLLLNQEEDKQALIQLDQQNQIAVKQIDDLR